MADPRRLIVNADDFGLSPGVNQGIIIAHENGIVTSASLMVRWPAAAEAARYARRTQSIGIGLHVDLGEWAFRDGLWSTLYEVVPGGDRDAIARELSAQLIAFRDLVGRDPTHLDSHQHVHQGEPARTVLTECARTVGVPLRHIDPSIRYRGDFYGQDGKGRTFPKAIGVDALMKLLRDLPPGTTELACHPGLDEQLDSMYRHERAIEVSTLCDPRVRAAIVELGIELIRFDLV